MSPTGNLDTTLSCLRQKKRAQNLKKNLLHFFALIFVQKISFSPPSEDRCLALQVKPRLRAGAFTRAKKFILFSSARQAKSFLFNFYAPRYCSADLDYARSRFGISNSLSVFTTNVLLPGESFLLASGFCSNFPRRCVSRRFFILNAAYFLSWTIFLFVKIRFLDDFSQSEHRFCVKNSCFPRRCAIKYRSYAE